MNFLSVETVAITLGGYPLSYVELIGTLFGFISVLLAARSNVLTWPTGIINECGFFLMFFQVQLYGDMLLQVFFLLVTLYGWYFWRRVEKKDEILVASSRLLFGSILSIISLTIILGYFIGHLHFLFPRLFEKEAASPYVDSFVTITSIFATFFLARKILHTWLLWILVDVVSIFLFYSRGIYFVTFEYAAFLVMAIYGYLSWRKKIV